MWFMTKLGLFFAVLGVVLIYALYKHYEPELPSVESIKEYRLQVPLRVFSADGQLISVFGTKRRIPVAIEDIPLRVKQAYIAAEDASFYSHPGFDIKGIMRAVWQIVTTGEKQGGGSTITQQLTRNVFLTLDQTWTRKIKELFLAVKLERTISKDEILELYLNKIALGHRSYGVAAAAEVYYGKTLDELTLAESAMLAAPPKAPSRINPVTNPERALQRRNYVLGRMLDLGFINQQEHDQAVAEEDQAYVHQPVVELNAPWVAEMVRTQMIDQFGDDAYTDGYDVITTVHADKQRAAEAALQNGLHAYDRRHGYRGAIQKYDLSGDFDLEEITEELSGFPQPGGLQAALVLEVDEASSLARLGDGQDIALSFESSQWAVPYIDNHRVGDKPKDLTEILSIGDVVMVKRGETGEFELSQIPQVQGALTSMNPDTGGLYALVGGFDYYLSKFNRATQAKRQPGSGFKPIVYSGALEYGLNAASIINDAPIVFEDDQLERTWRPENYSEKFFGPTRLREGIVSSRNLVSIRVLRQIGIRSGREPFKMNGPTPHSAACVKNGVEHRFRTTCVDVAADGHGLQYRSEVQLPVGVVTMQMISVAQTQRTKSLVHRRKMAGAGEVVDLKLATAVDQLACHANKRRGADAPCDQGDVALTRLKFEVIARAANFDCGARFQLVHRPRTAAAGVLAFDGDVDLPPILAPTPDRILPHEIRTEVNIDMGAGFQARETAIKDFEGKITRVLAEICLAKQASGFGVHLKSPR